MDSKPTKEMFNFEVRKAPVGIISYITLTVKDLDIDNYRAIQEGIMPIIEKNPYVIIDLTNVSYVDPSGLQALVRIAKKVKDENRGLSLIITNPQVKKIFNITGLVKIFDIFETGKDAIDSFQKPQQKEE